MKRWNVAEMLEIGEKLFAKIHKQKYYANHNHDVHFMAREMNEWLWQGMQAMVDGSLHAALFKKKLFRR